MELTINIGVDAIRHIRDFVDCADRRGFDPGSPPAADMHGLDLFVSRPLVNPD